MTENTFVSVADLCEFMGNFAPLSLAEAWDNVGLLLGRKHSRVKTLMTCLTLTEDVAQEARKKQVNLIITHHPVMFRSVKKLTDETSEGRTILTLLESGIAVYSPHTAFDSTFSGINQQFAEALGLLEIQPLRPSTSSETVGSGRLGRLLSSETPTNFVKRVTTALNLSSLEVSLNCGTVQRVAVACGAASEFLPDAIRLQCDTFITGEARFHSILEARAAGLNLILVGHYASERFAVERLSQEIGRRFPSLCSFASEAEENPTRIMTA